MKKAVGAAAAVMLAAALFAISGCGAESRMGYSDGIGEISGNWTLMVDEGNVMAGDGAAGNYTYGNISEVGFSSVAEEPASYFSLDRNTAGYSLMRAQIMQGRTISADSVRAEELVNYFSYSYPVPEDGKEISVSTYLSECPWNADSMLMTVGIRTQKRVLAADKNNYVFLVDVSGSMSGSVDGLEGTTRLDLIKTGVAKLLEGLGDQDYVSIVTYASGTQVQLPATAATAAGKRSITATLGKLSAYGGTNGEGGLRLAYEEAQKNFSADGNNRVIVMTDGDFNVGMSSSTELKEFVQEQAKSGVYLSVLGVGMGNTRDDLMETLAMNGNGNYAYIDTPDEAKKVLSEELDGMLTPVAKDAKAGITFTDAVEEYRIIGYDLKLMSQSDYENDEKDAGEIGSNLCVTVLYELRLAEDAGAGTALATAEVRYKAVGEDETTKTEKSTLSLQKTGGDDQKFAACVAEFALILRQSQYRGEATLNGTLSRLKDLAEYTEGDVYKTEFILLVEKAITSGFYGE